MRVRDNQRVLTEDGMRAKGDIARSLDDREPDPGFEPLPIALINETNAMGALKISAASRVTRSNRSSD